MKKTGISVLAAMFLIMFCHIHASRAETVYSIGSGDVPVRATPNPKGKVLSSISPGVPVQIQQSNRWVLVEFSDGSGNSRKGWVDAIFLGPKPPEGMLVKQLEADNQSLKASLEGLEKEREELLNKEKALTEKLASIESSYEDLKIGSSNYLQLKEEHEATMASLEKLKEDFEILSQENQSLKVSQRIKWFGAGGVVLLLGWFIGWVNGRHQRKKRSSYFF